MKERGAIVRPSDIEQANHQSKHAKKAQTTNNASKQLTESVTPSQVPPKSQTPNVELGNESMLVAQ
jgi:hypothetical protein